MLLDELEAPIYVLFYSMFNKKFAAKNSGISCFLTLDEVHFL